MDNEPIDCRDERTVQMLYLKLGRSALAKTMAIVGLAAAEEIVQEVFTKLWQAQMRFAHLKMAYSWVYKSCTNAAIDFIRNKNNRHVPISNLEFQSDLNLEDKTDLQQVWQELTKILSPGETALFLYRNLEGLSQDEIAEVMQVSRRTVNRLQSQLNEKLAKFKRGLNVT
jgi:RNA polymerase sigma-70 factor (ECF subfamily)